jgi:hypothetical protein
VKCFASTVDGRVTLSLTALVTVLDILTDIMSEFTPLLIGCLSANFSPVVSIPILVLKGSQLSRSTKFGLIAFLCLSIFMAICAIIRVSGFEYHGVEDDSWQFFWQQAEGTIAVMMASITAFRTLFVRPTNDPDVSTPRSPVENFYQNLRRRFQTLAQAKPEEKPGSTKSAFLKLPKLPAPTFTGVRTFIRRNNRTGMSAATFDSELDPSEVEYHAALRAPYLTPRGSASENEDGKQLSKGGSSNSLV